MSNYALPEEVFEGEIVEMDPAIDPVTRTVQVVGMVDNPDLLLRAGMLSKQKLSRNRGKMSYLLRAISFCGGEIRRSFLSKKKAAHNNAKSKPAWKTATAWKLWLALNRVTN